MRRLAAIVLSAAALAGCGIESWKYKSYPPNPYPDLQTVVVLPFINQTRDMRLDVVEMAQVMSNEITKFDGFRVIRPLQIVAAGGGVPTSMDEVLRWGKMAKADAVLVVAVTDYDAFDPPRMAVSIQFLRVQGKQLSAGDIDKIVQSASWRRGPLAVGHEKAGNFIDAFEAVYDSHEERIRKELVAYAQAQEETDSPFAPEREFMAVQPRFWQFVSNQVLNRLFDRTAAQ